MHRLKVFLWFSLFLPSAPGQSQDLTALHDLLRRENFSAAQVEIEKLARSHPNQLSLQGTLLKYHRANHRRLHPDNGTKPPLISLIFRHVNGVMGNYQVMMIQKSPQLKGEFQNLSLHHMGFKKPVLQKSPAKDMSVFFPNFVLNPGVYQLRLSSPQRSTSETFFLDHSYLKSALANPPTPPPPLRPQIESTGGSIQWADFISSGFDPQTETRRLQIVLFPADNYEKPLAEMSRPQPNHLLPQQTLPDKLQAQRPQGAFTLYLGFLESYRQGPLQLQREWVVTRKIPALQPELKK